VQSTLTIGDRAGSRGAGKGAHLFIALECHRPWAGGARHGLADVDVVLLGRGPARAATREAAASERRLSVTVPDRWMSTSHARLLRVLGRWVLEDSGSKNGSRVNGAPARRAILDDGDLLELGHTFFVFREALDGSAGAPLDVTSDGSGAPARGLATLLPALTADFSRLATVARSDVAVALRGESGTGKELAARAVHELSGRRGPFLAINCGALPDTLLASELFGYRRGAFSGAAEDRPGLVRSADGGTLFLDEIGDLPLAAQPSLLRVLQEREVTPLGGARPVPIDVRLVTATHHDLASLVDAGRFRADLLARLAGFELVLPPLRERREDLGVLVAELLRRVAPARAGEVALTVDTARALFQYDMPLNVRELEKCLATAVVLAGDGAIEPRHLSPAVRSALEAPSRRVLSLPPRLAPEELDDDETPLRDLSPASARQREELLALMLAHAGNVSAVARSLGKARMQVQRWLKRYRIDPTAYRR
jgi:DNA-binding NtrC family response regulator